MAIFPIIMENDRKKRQIAQNAKETRGQIMKKCPKEPGNVQGYEKEGVKQ